jgi:hypothetical protein
LLYPVFRKIPPALHIVFNVVFQDAAGNKIGSFSYLSPEGKVFRTDYVADALGYRVASNALPVGPSAPAAAGTTILARRRRGIAAPLAAPFAAPLATPFATPFATPLASPYVSPLAGPLSSNLIAQLVLIGPNTAVLVIKKAPLDLSVPS